GVGPPTTAAVRLPAGPASAIREVIALIRQVAAFDSTALVLGESGTGKEVVARAIHDLSPRSGRPFLAVKRGALPPPLGRPPAAPPPPTCSNPSCSATRKAPSPAPSPPVRAGSRLPKAA